MERKSIIVDLSVGELHDLDFGSWTKWKIDIQAVLCAMDLDLALLEDEPTKPTEISSAEEKSTYHEWKRSNRASLLFMQSKMSNYVRSMASESDSAKQYLAEIENLVFAFERKGSSLLMDKLSDMKYDEDGKGKVHEHILKMYFIVEKFRALDWVCDDVSFFHLLQDSLPSQFKSVIKTAIHEGWTVNELVLYCADRFPFFFKGKLC